jgi:hypothetical protein
MVSSILALSLITVAIIFLRAVSFFSTLYVDARNQVNGRSRESPRDLDRIDGRRKGKGYKLVDEGHDLRVDLLLHPSLLLFQLGDPLARSREIKLGKVVDRSRLAERSKLGRRGQSPFHPLR